MGKIPAQKRPLRPARERKEFSPPASQTRFKRGQIALVVKNTAYKVATYKNPLFSLEDFTSEIAKEKQGNFDGAKNIGFGVGL